MSWYESVFEVIDMRSFSNLWYWIALAVLWSSVSHWVLGVPYDMILRARRAKEAEDEAVQDLHDLVRVNVNRILYIAEVSGVWLMLFGSAVLTALGVMSVVYAVEFAQAVLFLALPMSVLGALSVWTSRKIRATAPEGRDLIRRLMVHRFLTQLLGVISIFVTAMYGMYSNLYAVPFPN